MVSKCHTVAFHGITAVPVTVEVHFLPGLPKFTIVGLPSKSISESRERIRACFHAIGLDLPLKNVVVNLIPADKEKEGSHYDLPIALALFSAMDIIDPLELERYIVLGELGLDGHLIKTTGVLPAALYALSDEKGVICPFDNAVEASWVGGELKILSPHNLLELVHHFNGSAVLPKPPEHSFSADLHYEYDLAQVKGQHAAKRALEIAAVGSHNILMVGPPGTGKSMLAKRLPSILPPLSPLHALETTVVYSLAGLLPKEGIMRQVSFREPHHSSSLISLVGGGRKTKPGEISLAHNGVLFLDELPEFSRMAIESLRQPIESGEIVVARADNHVSFPAHFQLVAAMNPCRCGFFGNPKKQCSRTPQCAEDYQNKISGPIMDRFDIFAYMMNIDIKDLHGKEEESSAVVRARVIAAREFQSQRKDDGLKLSEVLQDFFIRACEKLDISARRHNRILRVARTIADLVQSDFIEKEHLLEALSYRVVSLTR